MPIIKPELGLLLAIRKAGMRQADFAKIVNESPSTISLVVNGRLNIDEPKKRKFAKALNRRVDEVFDECTHDC